MWCFLTYHRCICGLESLSGYQGVIEFSLCLAELFLVFVSAGCLFPATFQQEPCIMCWWWKIFLRACFFTHLTTFPDSCTVLSPCLAKTSHLPPVALFCCSFLFGRFFPPCFVSSPLAIPSSPSLLCDCLPNAGHPVGLVNVCFCSCCMNPEGTFWIQKLLFSCHSVCLSYHLEQ